MTRRAGAWAFFLTLVALIADSTSARADEPILDRVVLVMRHGIRPPTKAPPLPDGFTSSAWPQWPVAPGFLTPHGAEAIRLLARFERQDYAAAGLFARNGCVSPDEVSIWTDTDERTIKTGEAFAQGFAPGCDLKTGHVTGDHDALFSTLQTGTVDFDPASAVAGIQTWAGPGGVQAVADAHRAELDNIQIVLGDCCTAALCAESIGAPCTFAKLPTAIEAGKGVPKLKGALAIASTLSEILLLEYLEGKPMTDVGFGRIDRARVMATLALHPAEFSLIHRPPYIAARGGAALLRRIVETLDSPGSTPKLTAFVGHDTTLAYLGGALDLHWNAGHYPRDDPPPGATLGFERLHDATGRHIVRIFFEVQTPEQMRALTPLGTDTPPIKIYLRIPGCGSPANGTACDAGVFDRLVEEHTVETHGPAKSSNGTGERQLSGRIHPAKAAATSDILHEM